MMNNFLILLFFIGILSFSCSHGTIEKEKENLPTPTTNQEEETPIITYSNFTKDIIDNNCISCHSPAGLNISPYLTTYTQVKTITDSGKLKARVIEEIPSRMPPANSLPQDIKDTLQIWINQGALE